MMADTVDDVLASVWASGYYGNGALDEKAEALSRGDGWRLMPTEATPRMLADTILATMDAEPTADDYTAAKVALTLLPPSSDPRGPRVLADLAMDYRAMIAAAPPVPEGEE